MKTSMPVQPKYQNVADDLRRQIQGGLLKPGDRLPSFTEMRVRQGVTQPTMERAHAILEREGLIRREPGRGTFVLSPAVARGAAASPRRLSLMDHTVAILTQDEGEAAMGHHYSGWREFITIGAVEAVRAARLHVLTLHPNRLTAPDLTQLAAAQPFGVAVTEVEISSPELLAQLDVFHRAGVPVAVYGDLPGFAGYDRVTPDQDAGAYTLTRWLIAQGRRRIVNVWPTPASSYWFADRLAGYRRAMTESGLEPLDPILVPPYAPGGPARENFEQNARSSVGYLADSLLGSNPIDAILASSDGDVFALAAACRLLRKEPNKDVFLVGYDDFWPDSPERQWEPCIPLATIDKGNEALGAALIGLLADRSAGLLPSEAQCRRIAPKLIVTEAGQRVADPALG